MFQTTYGYRITMTLPAYVNVQILLTAWRIFKANNVIFIHFTAVVKVT